MRAADTDPKSLKRSAAGSLTVATARLLSKAWADALEPLDLAPAQFAVLSELWVRDGLTQSELAQQLDVEQATMSNTLKRLLRDGLIRYEPHPRDTRAKCVRLTDRSALLKEPARAIVRNVHERAFGHLTRKEQKRLVELSTRVIAALKSEATAGSDVCER